MDSKNSEGEGGVAVAENSDKPPENSNLGVKSLVSNVNDVRSQSAKNSDGGVAMTDSDILLENPNPNANRLVSNVNEVVSQSAQNNEDNGGVALSRNSDKPPEILDPRVKSSVTNVNDVGSRSAKNTESDGGVAVFVKPPETSNSNAKGLVINVNDVGSQSVKNSEGDGGMAVSKHTIKPPESNNSSAKSLASNVNDVGSQSAKNSVGDGGVVVSKNSDKAPQTTNSNTKCLASNVNDGQSAKNSGVLALLENCDKPLETRNRRAISLVPNINNLGSQSAKINMGDGGLAVAENSSKPTETPNPGTKSKIHNGSDVGSQSAKSMYFRADRIDFKSWDIQLEKHLSRVWSREKEPNTKKEEWEIDLAKLDLKSVVAHGTYGTVYKASYDGQDVAVKVLDWGEDGMSTVAETASLRASFRQEVAVWHKLNHPNIPKFIGASMGTLNLKIPTENPSGSLPSRACCVVVEYLAGGTLKNYLIRNSRRKLALRVVIQFALDIARGLNYLHSKKIVHRDVKSENMLLDTNRSLKIADFGVARVEALNPRDMTGETGTLGYMAPEVLSGKPYNRKCDVYSFGICLWEIYCCDMPYPNLSFVDVSSAVVRQNLRPEMPRCCPSSVASIMRKCWDANPDKRPEMDAVVRLLEAVDTSKGGGMIPDDQVPQSCFCFGPTRGSK